jgi:hypothetical protein
MDNYTLIVLVALLLGVIGIIVILERRRRTELTQYIQFYQTLFECLSSLQAIHSNNETQTAQVVDALSRVRTAIETGIKNSSESAATLSKETISAVKQGSSLLETAVQRHQNALDATLAQAADKLSESSVARTKELLSEVQHTTKAIQDLKASLEESINFK